MFSWFVPSIYQNSLADFGQPWKYTTKNIQEPRERSGIILPEIGQKKSYYTLPIQCFFALVIRFILQALRHVYVDDAAISVSVAISMSVPRKA